MKPIRNPLPGIVTAAVLALWGTGMAQAQVDPPDRVARLNFVQGSISYLPAGGADNDWVAAVPNRPLTTGDRLWADSDSRGELHIGSTAIRLDSNTGISFLNLTDTTMQIRLAEGSMIVKLRRLDQGNSFEVDTPNLAFSLVRPGNYRVDARPDGAITVITVQRGEGEVIGGGRSFQVISDQQVTLTGTDTLDYDLKDADAQPASDFDQWAMSRDAREDHVNSTRYVSPEMTGYEDLDTYGSWQVEPGYGNVWVPAGVPGGWAPYRFGHWVWIEPWGWTWVEDEPWGFAPFHYGRWAFASSVWFWVPGPVVVRPVYAPALVAWVGGVHIGVGVGVGWFPLGPHEVFVPAYRVSERYVTNMNVTNTIVERTTVVNVYRNQNIENITYVNRRAPNAVTVVSHETFVNARPVGRNIVNVASRELESARVSREIVERPERASIYGAGVHNAPHPPVQMMNRPVVARQVPPPAPSHFERMQNAPSYRPPNRTGNQSNQPASEAGRMVPNAEAGKPRQSDSALARPAPPVRPPTQREQADVQAKQKVWQNAHPRGSGNQSRERERER
jgi:hypothetical protein